MVEAFDAANATNSFADWIILAVCLATGVLLEFFVLRWLRRAMTRLGWFPGEVVFTAISGQALFWCSLLGLTLAGQNLLPQGRWRDLLLQSTTFLAVMAVTILVVRLIINTVRFYFVHQQIGSVSLINNSLRVLGTIVVIATALATLGVPVGPLLTVVAGSSVGLSLALRDPLSNLFGGMTVLASNKIRPGDYIRLNTGQEGYVTDIRWSDTYIRELANNLIVIPNALMTNEILTNFHRPDPELAVLLDMGFSYGTDLARVEAVVTEVAAEVMEQVPGGVPTFEPFVRFNVFGESSVRCTVILRGQSFVDQFLIKHEFFRRLSERFSAEGLPPPAPVRIVQLDGQVPLAFAGEPGGNGQQGETR